MEKYLTLPMFLAFVLGVVLSAMVKQLLGTVRSHASTAVG